MTPQIDADIARRKGEVASWLADLGFGAPRDLEIGVLGSANRGEPVTVTFAKAKITVATTGEVRLGAKVLGQAPGADSFTHAAYWLPSVGEIVYIAGRPGHECCDSTDPVWVVVAKL